jgi:tetratricopeptide (TPR) repeat protein
MGFKKYPEHDAPRLITEGVPSGGPPKIPPIPAADLKVLETNDAIAEIENFPAGRGNDADAPGKSTTYDRAAGLALEAFRKGDFRQAVYLFSELPESDIRALTGKGVSYFKLGNYHDAVVCLEKAAALKSDDFITFKFLAVAYYKIDEVRKSRVAAEKALSIREDSELRTLYPKLLREEEVYRTYVEENTNHFKVLFDGYEHGSIEREIVSILEDAYRNIGKELNYFPSSPVTVIIYTDKDFRDTTQAPEWSDGIFDGKIRVPVKGVEPGDPSLKKILLHEYSHAVVHSLAPGCPVWIHEGVAEYFSESYPPAEAGQVIPLTELERPFSRLSGVNVPAAYAESYSAVSYLIEKFGMFRLKELLLSLSRGNDINASFREAFGLTYDDFVSQWGRGRG